jgi:hypothetical protein
MPIKAMNVVQQDARTTCKLEISDLDPVHQNIRIL